MRTSGTDQQRELIQRHPLAQLAQVVRARKVERGGRRTLIVVLLGSRCGRTSVGMSRCWCDGRRWSNGRVVLLRVRVMGRLEVRGWNKNVRRKVVEQERESNQDSSDCSSICKLYDEVPYNVVKVLGNDGVGGIVMLE